MRIGDLIDGRFRVEARAGSGAMGVVFRARDGFDGSAVALKTWHDDGVSPANRFLREAAALARLSDPAIVRYIAHGLSDRARPYLAMEWIEGQTLAERLAGEGLTPLETLELGERLLQGLAALHAHGIVHRDLKPSNVMLPGGRVRDAKILDLGVARVAQAATDLTAAGSHLGTPRYMAPEQIRDPRLVDGRADVFALGCVLFECLTGVPAFAGDEPLAVLAQIMFGQAPDPSELRPDLPEEVDQLIMRLLARRLEARPAVNAALRAELARLRQLPHLGALTAQHSQPPVAARMLSMEAAETLWEASAERPSSPRLLDRASRPIQTFLAQPPPYPLIGRARELEELSHWLESGQPVTLWGGAGVGKTRLAQELARSAVQQRGLPAYAVVLCDVREARDSRELVRICAEAVGLPLPAADDPEDGLGRQLRKLGPLLLILDRTEQLAREIDPLIALWLRHAPDLRLLLTSRVLHRSTRAYQLGPLACRLRPSYPASAGGTAASTHRLPSAAAELVLTLARNFPESVPGTASAAGSAGASATRLTGSLASASETGSSLNESSGQLLEQAEQIASALDGNPLAIELAMARLPLLGFQGILERLPAPLSLLERNTSHVPGMRDSIEWSWQLLQAPERSALMQCSVFHGPFSLSAAERVLRLPPGSPSVLALLESLREQSLLVARGVETAGLTLSMPAVLREFAREQLAHTLASTSPGATQAEGPQPESSLQTQPGLGSADTARSVAADLSLSAFSPSLSGLRERHAAYCSEMAEFAQRAGEQAPDAIDSADWMAALDHVLSPLGSDVSRALSLLLALERPLLAGGRGSRLAAQLDRTLGVLRSPTELPDALASKLARARQLRARLLAPSGELALAQSEFEAVQREAERLQDRHLLGTCLLDLGVVHHFRRDLPAANACYEAALDVLSELDDPVAEARCQGNQGAIFHDQAQLSQAALGYRRAIALLPPQGQDRLLANFQGNLALVEHERGHVEEARELYEKACALLEALLDARLLGIVLGNYGTLELAQQQLDRALARLERAHALLERSGDRHSEGLSLARLGVALALVGRIPEAEQRAARAQRLLRKDAVASAVAALLASSIDLARAEQAQAAGRTCEASEALERAGAACERARSQQHAGARLYDQSDDLRHYLAILEPRLAAAERTLRPSSVPSA